MIRRPLCTFTLGILILLWILNGMGIPVIRGNPLPESIQNYIRENPQVQILGEIISTKESEQGQTLVLRNTFLIFRSEKYPIHNIQVYMDENCGASPGSLVVVSGILEEIEEARNPGEFDYRQYQAARHIYYRMKKGILLNQTADHSRISVWLELLRDSLREAIESCAFEAAGIFETLVLGDRSGLDEEMQLRFRMTSIAHLFSVSGMHIGILGLGLYRLLKKAGARIWSAGCIALSVVLLYSLLCGSGTSSIRAVTMFGLSMGAAILYRIYDLPTALALSALLILAESPAYLLNSSFLLSFGAVIGAGILSPFFCKSMKIRRNWQRGIVTSITILLVTMPILLYSYGEVSFLGIFLNILILPTAPILLYSAMGTALLGCLSLRCGIAAAFPGRLLTVLYDVVTRIAGRASILVWTPGCPEIWQILLYYMNLGLMVLLLRYLLTIREKAGTTNVGRRRGIADHKELLVRGICLGGMILCILILQIRLPHPFQVTFLDVGQGDCTVMELPEGNTVLIDCGSSSKNQTAQKILIPYLKHRGIRTVDAVIVSHSDRDHVSGILEWMDLMEKHLTVITFERLLLPEISCPDENWITLKEKAESLGIEVMLIHQGDAFTFSGGNPASLRILSPESGADGVDSNRDAAVLQIEYMGIKGLFTGDITDETEKELIERGVLEDIDYLKVAHHGSRYSTGTEFLEITEPELAVISCSESNNYGHPHPDTIRRLDEAGCHIEYTMERGAVMMRIENGEYYVEEFLNLL